MVDSASTKLQEFGVLCPQHPHSRWTKGSVLEPPVLHVAGARRVDISGGTWNMKHRQFWHPQRCIFPWAMILFYDDTAHDRRGRKSGKGAKQEAEKECWDWMQQLRLIMDSGCVCTLSHAALDGRKSLQDHGVHDADSPGKLREGQWMVYEAGQVQAAFNKVCPSSSAAK